VASNSSLVKLLPQLVALQAPRPEDMLGLQNRTALPNLGNNADFAYEFNHIQSLRMSGAILALMGQPTAAETVLRTGAQDNVLIRFWLAFALAQQNQRNAALQTLGSVRWTDEYFAQAGLREQDLGHYETATRLLEAAATLDSGGIRYRSFVYETLAKNTYIHLGDWDASVHWAERWIQVAPEDTYAYNWLAALYLWRGEPEVAYGVLQRAEQYDIENSRYYPGQMGEIYQSRGQWERAIQSYRESWKRNKDDPEMVPFVAWSLGSALYYQKHLEEARFYLEVVRSTGTAELQQQASDLLAKIKAENAP